MNGVRIEQAARRLGVHPSTLRRLEKQGVFKAGRNWANHRIYLEEEIKEIEKILFPKKSENER